MGKNFPGQIYFAKDAGRNHPLTFRFKMQIKSKPLNKYRKIVHKLFFVFL
jgi:hypothetical protein